MSFQPDISSSMRSNNGEMISFTEAYLRLRKKNPIVRLRQVPFMVTVPAASLVSGNSVLILPANPDRMSVRIATNLNFVLPLQPIAFYSFGPFPAFSDGVNFTDGLPLQYTVSTFGGARATNVNGVGGNGTVDIGEIYAGTNFYSFTAFGYEGTLAVEANAA